MIASSIVPNEYIIGMNFNSEKQVEKHIAENKLEITHWLLYDCIGSDNELSVVYEKKDNCMIIDRMQERINRKQERNGTL